MRIKRMNDVLISVRKWRSLHPEQAKETHAHYSLKYRNAHLEKCRKDTREWRRDHPNSARDKKHLKNWKDKHPEAWRNIVRRDHFNRRKLGFDILWQSERKGIPMDFHHINKTFVVTIPSSLHDSIKHAFKNTESMKRMNEVAFNYIIGEVLNN